MSFLVNGVDSIMYYAQPQLDRIGTPLYELCKPVYNFNFAVARILGQHPANSMYIVCMVSSFIFCLLYRLLPRGMFSIKHLLNASIGIFMVCINFQWGFLHTFFMFIMSFLIIRILPRKTIPKVLFVFNFGYLGICNIWEMFAYPYEWRPSAMATQMIICLKCVSIGWNLLDYEKHEKGMDLQPYEKPEKKKKMSAILEALMVEKKPSFLQFISYIYFFPGVTSGPTFEYRHYIEWVERDPKLPRIPFDVITILKKLFWSIFFLILFIALGMYGISREMTRKEFLKDKNLFYIIFLCNLQLFFIRTKYYFAWYFAEANLISIGFGYDETAAKEGKGNKWANVQTSDCIATESSASIREIIVTWNISVSKWIRRYAYMRAPFKASTTKQIAAMTISALWHGFYPGYYIMWVSLVFASQFYTEVYRKIRPRIIKEGETMGVSLHAFLFLVTNTLISHLVQPFNLLSLEECIFFYGRFYFGFHIAVFVLYFVMKIFPPIKKNRTKKEEKVENGKED